MLKNLLNNDDEVVSKLENELALLKIIHDKEHKEYLRRIATSRAVAS